MKPPLGESMRCNLQMSPSGVILIAPDEGDHSHEQGPNLLSNNVCVSVRRDPVVCRRQPNAKIIRHLLASILAGIVSSDTFNLRVVLARLGGSVAKIDFNAAFRGP